MKHTKESLGVFLLLALTSVFASDHLSVWFEIARKGELKAAEEMLRNEPDILNKQDPKGYTALVLASYNNHRSLTLDLLKRGADPCSSDLKGNTALMGVIFKGHEDITFDLIDRCNVNIKNKEGQTALMFASLFGREKIARKLIELGADKELKDHEGRTAESLAESQWNRAMVLLLKTFNVIKN